MDVSKWPFCLLISNLLQLWLLMYVQSKEHFTYVCVFILFLTPRTVWKWCCISTYDHHPCTAHTKPHTKCVSVPFLNKTHLFFFRSLSNCLWAMCLKFWMNLVLQCSNRMSCAQKKTQTLCADTHTQCAATNSANKQINHLFNWICSQNPCIVINVCFSTPALAGCLCVCV